MSIGDSFSAYEAVVNFMLDNFDYANACFLAERVHAEVKSEESLKLVASSYFRNGDFYKTYHLLRDHDHLKSPELKFLLAQCCFRMKKYSEAERILTCNSVFKRDAVPVDEIIKEFGTSAAFALAMVADINRLSCRPHKAKEFYRKSLSLNPFLWTSYQHLCELGESEPSESDHLFSFSRPSHLDCCLRQSCCVQRTSFKTQSPAAVEHVGVPRGESTPWIPSVNPETQQTRWGQGWTLGQTRGGGPLNSDFFKRETMNSISNISMNTTNPAEPNEDTHLMFTSSKQTSASLMAEDEVWAEDLLHMSKESAANDSSFNSISNQSNESRSPSGGGNRRLTRRQSKLMAAQGGANTFESAKSYGDTPLNNNAGGFETPDEQMQFAMSHQRAPAKPTKVVKSIKPALLSLSNLNQSEGASSAPNANTVPLAPTNNNASNQVVTQMSCRTPTSGASTPEVKPSPVVTSTSPSKSHLANQASSGLVASQQANFGGNSTATTPLHAPPTSANAGLRRSSRINYGSNQLKENSKALSKASMSRRHKMDRAPNKSNSITNALNAEEDKLLATQARLSQDQLEKQSPQKTQLDENMADVHLSSVATQTICVEFENTHEQPVFCAIPPILDSNKRTFVPEDLEPLLRVFKVLGRAYSLLTGFQSDLAISALQELPFDHLETGWVLECIGRAHCEKSEYQQAVRVFKHMWDVEPYRVSGVDVYSTALWHLKMSNELSFLAHEMVAMVRDKPQVWCVVGNCFALQKEHEHAIQFLGRAIQVDPTFHYAYSLLGFEYMEVGTRDKAENCFRNAIRIQPRHYTAWCGLAQLYFQQEKYTEAEVHYNRALSIKKNSPVLLCYLAVVLHKLNRSQQALDSLNEALALDPKNPLCKYHKAMILYSLNKCQDALKLLEELELQIPNESLLYFSIGQVYKKLGEPHLELMNFAWAIDLDPKGSSSLIKQAIEKNFLPRDKELQNSISRALDGGSLISDAGDMDSTIDDF